MPPSATFQVVDLHYSGTALTVQRRRAPGAHARTVDATTLDRIGKQVDTLVAAERRAGLTRDIVVPSRLASDGPGLAAVQRALGETLHELLDGADRALTRRLEAVRRHGATLHLVVQLRAANRTVLQAQVPSHPIFARLRAAAIQPAPSE